MDAITYVIKGDPIALARARHFNRKVYDSQKNEKLILGIELRRQHDERPQFTGPLQLDITFYMPVAQSNSKKCAMINRYHIYRPDLSNLIKFYEDLATEICYPDDCLISKIIAKKIYGDPRTELTISKLS